MCPPQLALCIGRGWCPARQSWVTTATIFRAFLSATLLSTFSTNPKYPQNGRKEVGGRRAARGTCPGQQLCAGRKSALVTDRGCRCQGGTASGAAHAAGSGLPTAPRAPSSLPRSRAANLHFCTESPPCSSSPGAVLPRSRRRRGAAGSGTGCVCSRARGWHPRSLLTGGEQRKSASEEDERLCSAWNGSSLGREVEPYLGGDGSPLGR